MAVENYVAGDERKFFDSKSSDVLTPESLLAGYTTRRVYEGVLDDSKRSSIEASSWSNWSQWRNWPHLR